MQQMVLITGGTGMVGQKLSTFLHGKGYNITILTRKPGNTKKSEHVRYAEWDIKKQSIDIPAVQNTDHIIHLAGAGVMDKRWTDSYKNEILLSRTMSSKLLIDTLNQYPNKVRSIISASGIGWYGKDKENIKYFIETDPPANDFLGQTCFSWEESISMPTKNNIRVCKLRTGIVMANEGGALQEFKKPLGFGIAAILGSGKQMTSWIHIDDLCRLYLYAIENTRMIGSFNAVSDKPVTNKFLTLNLAKLLRGKFVIPLHVPSIVLKVVMGDSSIEVLKSTSVSNQKLKQTGFTFQFAELETALKDLVNRS
ncbi:MAG: TIGR01777 family oxidoreductase [Ferruginibacter sp.]